MLLPFCPVFPFPSSLVLFPVFLPPSSAFLPILHVSSLYFLCFCFHHRSILEAKLSACLTAFASSEVGLSVRDSGALELSLFEFFSFSFFFLLFFLFLVFILRASVKGIEFVSLEISITPPFPPVH